MLPDDPDPARRADKLSRIVEALIHRVDRLEETRGSAWSTFQAAVALEQEALARTRDLEAALADLSQRNRDLAVALAAAGADVARSVIAHTMDDLLAGAADAPLDEKSLSA